MNCIATCEHLETTIRNSPYGEIRSFFCRKCNGHLIKDWKNNSVQVHSNCPWEPKNYAKRTVEEVSKKIKEGEI